MINRLGIEGHSPCYDLVFANGIKTLLNHTQNHLELFEFLMTHKKQQTVKAI